MDLSTIAWDCCRICLKEGEMHSVFETIEDLTTIAERIMHCSTINITKGGRYPEQICTLCLNDLNVAYRFRVNCESSESILTSMVETTKEDTAANNHSSSSLIMKNRVKREPPPQSQQHTKRSNTIGTVARVKQEIPWTEHNDNDVDCHNNSESDNDNDDAEPNKDSEIIYMEEEEPNRQLTQDEIAEYFEFVPEDGEKREGVWSEIFKTDKEGVEFKVMHVKPIVTDGGAAATTVVGDDGAKKVSAGSSPNKRGPYKKGPKTPKMCQWCGNTYRNQSLLDGHMRRHMNDRPFECQVCSKAFVIKIELSRHMRTHTGQKPYACKFCDRRFSDFGTRIKHERTHTGERPYKCELCPKSFAYTHVLSRHMLSHTGEKPYGCPYCVKKFTKREYMKTHVKKHHPTLEMI